MLVLVMVPMVLAMLDMLLPMPMVPTMERGLLMLTTAMLVLVMVPMVLAMLAMLLPMPMVPTTERGLLMLSPRLMPTTELMAMLVLVMVPMVLAMAVPSAMVPTPMPTVSTASKMSSQPQIRVAHQVQTEAQKQTKSRSNLTFSAMN